MKRALGLGIFILGVFFARRWIPSSGGLSSKSQSSDGPSLGPPSGTHSIKSNPIIAKSQNREDALENFLEKRSLPGWQIFRGKGKRVKSIVGMKIPLASGKPEDVLSLAREIAPLFGVKGQDIDWSRENSKISGSAFDTFHFEQRVDGIVVFGADLSMSINREDQSVFVLNNSLKPMSSYDPDPALSQDQAQNSVMKYYESREPQIVKAAPQYLLYANDSGLTELAWLFYVNLAQPKRERLQVLWGAESGKLLSEISVISN